MVDIVIIGEPSRSTRALSLGMQRRGLTSVIVPPADRSCVRELDPHLVIDLTDGTTLWERTDLMARAPDPSSSPDEFAAIADLVDEISRRCRQCSGERLRKVADITLDIAGVVCAVDDRIVDLTPTEFRLLGYLVDNADIVVSKEQILDRVFDATCYHPNVVEVHISALRRKIELDGRHRIETVRGVGYVIRSSTRATALCPDAS